MPGLQRAGAEMTRILCLDGVCLLVGRGQNENLPMPKWHPLQLPRDITALRRAVGELTSVQLLVLDPIEAFFDKDGNGRTASRAADLLGELAWDFGLAIVGVTKLAPASKRRRAIPMIDNKALAAAAGAAWGVVPSSKSERQHLLFSMQGGVEELGPALTFNLGATHEQGRIQWNAEPFEMTATDFGEEQNAGIKFAIAASWLKGLLLKGPQPTQAIKQRALELGISPWMLRSVQAELGIKPGKKSGFQGGGTWQLPAGSGIQPSSEVPENRDEKLPIEGNSSPPTDEKPSERLTIGERASLLEKTGEIFNREVAH